MKDAHLPKGADLINSRIGPGISQEYEAFIEAKSNAIGHG
jgi:hypothetical protein